MNYYIGADLGTSALKLLLVSDTGEIINTVSEEYEVHYPAPSYSEQNPEDWWNVFKAGIKKLTKNIDTSLIRGIGAGGQMHGLVILDKDDRVIRPCILWNDGRTQKETDFLNEDKKMLSENTANIAFAGFTAPKILWLKENEPENFSKIHKIMLPKDYLNYMLTGIHATDFSDASGTLLLDVKNKCWSDKMLKKCFVKTEQMPNLFESYEVIGTIKKEIAQTLNLPEIPVVAGAGDNAAAAIGTNTVGDNKCNISLGTSGTIFISSKIFLVDKDNALHSFCHSDGAYHLMGCILSAASCNKWFCEEILKTNDFSSEQENIKNLGDNHVFFLPYLMGERSPINDTDARGTFIGMRMDTTRENMVLAVLEGVAFAMRDNFEIARNQGLFIASCTLCGGGAKSILWQKIFANVLNIPINLPKTEQGPGFGGAMLAMVGTKRFSSVEECAQTLVEISGTVYPDKDISSKYEAQYKKFREIYPSTKELFKKLK